MNKTPWYKPNNMLSMKPTGCSTLSPAGCSPTVPEVELHRSVQAILAEGTRSQHPAHCYAKGMLRWTLHKKVRSNPANSLTLVLVLITELEKAWRWDCRKNIIPLLHMLMYAVIQTAYMPDELYKRVYNSCKRLLTLPHPYCTVGLSYTRQIKTERYIPGLMYQRMVVAEQSLKNEHYPFHEKVFVFADPEVFSGSLGQVVSEDIEAAASASGRFLSPSDHMCSVIQHSIQAALGEEQCHGPKLTQALKDMDQEVEPHFQEVLEILEQSVEEGGRGEGATLRSRLQQLYRKIVRNTESDPLFCGSLCDSPLPNPEMSFYLWTKDLDIWREVRRWFRSSSMSENFEHPLEQEDFKPGDLPSDPSRYSVASNDSGISLLTSADPPSSSSSLDPGSTPGEQFTKLTRQGAIKPKPSAKDRMAQMGESLEYQASLGGGGGRRGSTLQRQAGIGEMQSFKQQKPLTARIVAMGDDRVLGHLAKAYYSFRKREARKPYLTLKVSFQFYYIPVCKDPTPVSVQENLPLSKGNPCTLGSYLGMVDPWYDFNIKCLGSIIPNLAKMQQANPKIKDSFLSDVISYYARTGRQPVYFTIYFVKISFCSKDPEEEVCLTHLEIEFPEFKKMANSVKEKHRKTSGEILGAVVSVNYKEVTISGRDIDRGASFRTSGAQISTVPSSETEDLDCLTLTFNESHTKNKNMEPKIRTSSIKIRALEGKSFTVTLDKDCRRKFKDVQSIEISPCLDPGYCVQKTVKSKSNQGDKKDAGLSKYMNKGFSLPINTFAGIIN